MTETEARNLSVLVYEVGRHLAVPNHPDFGTEHFAVRVDHGPLRDPAKFVVVAVSSYTGYSLEAHLREEATFLIRPGYADVTRLDLPGLLLRGSAADAEYLARTLLDELRKLVQRDEAEDRASGHRD